MAKVKILIGILPLCGIEKPMPRIEVFESLAQVFEGLRRQFLRANARDLYLYLASQ
jgi:hypothetical protein